MGNLKNYEYIDNGSDKLIIVCSSHPNGNSLLEVLDHTEFGSTEYLVGMQKIWDRCSFYNIKSNYNFNFLFLKDVENDYMGYMYIRDEEYILEEYVSNLDKFLTIHEYTRSDVTIVGTSKGGFISRAIAYTSSMIGNVVVGIPQIHFKAYDKENAQNKVFSNLYELMWSTPKKREHTERVQNLMITAQNSNIKEHIFTGTHDGQYNILKQLSNHDATFYVTNEELKHSDIIVKNVDIFYRLLFAVASNDTEKLDIEHFEIRLQSEL